MKRAGGLWPALSSFENLLGAAHDAAAGKRSRPDVAAFLFQLEYEIAALRRELLDGSYTPGPYRVFTVLDPKPRQISAAPFRDRVVHHALTRILEPIFERRFSPHSYACRTGLGTHAALARARDGVRRFPYVLKCDVRKYFASIDHEILNDKLARVIKCKPTLQLAARIIAGSNPQEDAAAYFPGDDLFTPYQRRRGLPLGNQTSQFFANVYLDALDQLIGRRLRPRVYARYVDDLVLFGDDKQLLAEHRACIEDALAAVRLRLHPGKSRVYLCAGGVTFLGWRLFPGRIRLDAGNVARFRVRMRLLQSAWAAGSVAWDDVRQSVRAWIGHAAHGDTWLLRQRLLERCAFRARGVPVSQSPGRLLQQ